MRRAFVTFALAVLALTACSSEPVWTEVAARWRLLEAGETGRVVIHVEVGASACARFVRVDREQDADHVELRAVVEVTEDIDCIGDIQAQLTPVTLDEALGTRELSGCEPTDPAAACHVTGNVLD